MDRVSAGGRYSLLPGGAGCCLGSRGLHLLEGISSTRIVEPSEGKMNGTSKTESGWCKRTHLLIKLVAHQAATNPLNKSTRSVNLTSHLRNSSICSGSQYVVLLLLVVVIILIIIIIVIKMMIINNNNNK